MTIKGRNFDLMTRDGHFTNVLERCEVIAVHPHVDPFPGDVHYNHVDLQLIDRPRDAEGRPEQLLDVPVSQRLHGKFRGVPWNPQIGDMVIIAWLNDDVCFVLCTIPAEEQEPVCRSMADDYQQEVVRKLSPWEPPERDEDGNYVIFPNPKNPDCFKWWPKTRDSIYIFDCKNGHDCANCGKLAPCNKLDDIKLRTWFKNFSDISTTTIDEKWRFKFHHNSESVFLFDNDKTIHLANKVGCSTCGGTGCSGTCPTCSGTKLVDGELCSTCGGTGCDTCSSCNGSGCAEELGHQHFYPEGTNDIHAGFTQPNKDFIPLADEDQGVRVSVVHKDDTSVTFSFEAIDFEQSALIRIMKDGQIVISTPKKITIESTGDMVHIKAATEIKLESPLTHNTADVQTDGTCTHVGCNCSCCGT